MRRVIDVAVTGVALVALSPLLVAVAIGVRLGSPGPVLFRQPRVGRGGRPFTLLKFRTMWDGATGPSVTRAADTRVTPFGAWLRRWKLDELPQLLNVLRGDMTLLGPRPEVPRYLARLGAMGREYAAIQPGLADAATLAYYDEGALLAQAADPERHYLQHILPEKARLSIIYARERTLASDVRLLCSLARRIAGLAPAAPRWRDGRVEAGRQIGH
jgi:lipopolysaccharide/colanic/teichoic acid biosynthesis glycosyltransferase